MGLFAGGFFRFPGHLRQEVVPFLQIGGGIFPQLLSHLWLLRIEATEALLLQQLFLSLHATWQALQPEQRDESI